ncbi:DUF4269 domain-containing protein [Nesterenkonia sp. NBAIMH1]|uniref:DUF4269 domain-containing protein n=1 Tax=Nesterenkonia sp. NBAIMH1 TaxID=2600320 RepID=UPI00143D9362|nr:DUF4269 domain-containing protein [Nesterenkonia sp. NBAIMH1]
MTAAEAERQLLTSDYLRKGNSRQQRAARTLDQLPLDSMPQVEEWALAGTVPLDIDLPNSDLDILISTSQPAKVRDDLTTCFSHRSDFSSWAHGREAGAWCAAFTMGTYPIEFFIQPTPVRKQRAFRHLVAEYVLLTRHGEEFREQIRQLKSSGMKTEPAFAAVLGLRGDPYLALLELPL